MSSNVVDGGGVCKGRTPTPVSSALGPSSSPSWWLPSIRDVFGFAPMTMPSDAYLMVMEKAQIAVRDLQHEFTDSERVQIALRATPRKHH
jgi:hypothetical protein